MANARMSVESDQLQILELKERINSLETLLNRKIRLTSYNADYLKAIQEKFLFLSKGKGYLNLEDLKQGFSLKSDFIARQIFRVMDKDQDGLLGEDEFLGVVEELLLGSEESKLRFMFSLIDLNDDRLISASELKRFLVESAVECGIDLNSEKIDLLVSTIFDECKSYHGYIGFDCYCKVMSHSSEVLAKTRVASTDWLMPPIKKSIMKGSWFKDFTNYLYNNRGIITFICVYSLANILLFLSAVNEYASQGANIYIQIARGCGACLNFNAMLILLPMVRYLTTWIRGHWLNKFIPVNQSLSFHRIVGHWMMVLSIVHTFAHLGNYQVLPNSMTHYLTQTQAGLTGVLLLAVFFAMWIVAVKQIKRIIPFETFYIVHTGYILWFAIALLHGPDLWAWVLVPIILFIIERVFRHLKGSKTLAIENVELLKSGVTKLTIRKEHGFNNHIGDYLFLKLPFISQFDWHPFTITSAPNEEHVTVHIRSVGNWSSRLYKYFKEHPFEPRDLYRARVDGPFSTPSSEIYKAETAVLVANGIGVTPFAAVLKDLLHKQQNAESGLGNLKKVYFVWINRNQQAFEWFTQLLHEIETFDKSGFIESRFYMTAGKYDLSTSALNAGLSLYHKNHGHDLVTSLASQTTMGRPEWSDFFTEVYSHHDTNVDVFVCGNDSMAKDINEQCIHYGFGFHKEVF